MKWIELKYEILELLIHFQNHKNVLLVKVSRFEKDNFFSNKKTFQDTLNREILTRFGFFFSTLFPGQLFYGERT